MAPASPSAVLAVPDRPLAERPEPKAPGEAADGQFAGLMAHLVPPKPRPEAGEATRPGDARTSDDPPRDTTTPAAPRAEPPKADAKPRQPEPEPPVEPETGEAPTTAANAAAQVVVNPAGMAQAAAGPAPLPAPKPTPDLDPAMLATPRTVPAPATAQTVQAGPVIPAPAGPQPPIQASAPDPAGPAPSALPVAPATVPATAPARHLDPKGPVAAEPGPDPKGAPAPSPAPVPPSVPAPQTGTTAPAPAAAITPAVLAETSPKVAAALRDGAESISTSVPAKPGPGTASSMPAQTGFQVSSPEAPPAARPPQSARPDPAPRAEAAPVRPERHPMAVKPDEPLPVLADGAPGTGKAVETPSRSEAPPPNPDGPAAKLLLSGQVLTQHPEASTPAVLTSLPKPVAPSPDLVATPSSKAPQPPPTPTAPVLQVEGGVRWMLKGGVQEAQLQLHPESLGQVTIHLRVEGGEVHARLWVTEPASVQAVQDGRPHLEQSLKEQGLQLGSFDLRQGHRPFQDTPSAPAFRDRLPAEVPLARQEAPAVPAPPILNPRRIELYA